MAIFLVIIVAITWVFSQVYSNPAVLYFGVIFSLIMNIGSYWYSDKIVLSIAGAREASHDLNMELYHSVENLSITAGLPMPKVYIIEDPVPNAFATGRDKEHATIAVTTGLLKILDRNELDGVIAHELSHIGNRDILISTVIVVLVGFIALISNWFLRFSFWGDGRRGDREGGGQVQMILLIVGIIFAILSPIIATLMQLAVSRKREFLADASGALLTRYPEGLASALEKISANSSQMKRANNATAHLYISNPFGEEKVKKSWITKMFSTHPPVEERVSKLRGKKQ